MQYFILKMCSKVLLTAEDRASFIDSLRRPSLSSVARKAITKKIINKCKAMTRCMYCNAINGKPC